jgi:hypothetical protein
MAVAGNTTGFEVVHGPAPRPLPPARSAGAAPTDKGAPA